MALAGVYKWLEHQLEDQRLSDSILGQGHIPALQILSPSSV